MWLKTNYYTTAEAFSCRRQNRFDFRRMVSVIINNQHTINLTTKMKTSFDPAKLSKRICYLFNRETKLQANGNSSQTIK